MNIDVDYGIESYAENTKDFEQVETIGFTAQAENKDEYVVSEPSEITVTVPVIEKNWKMIRSRKKVRIQKIRKRMPLFLQMNNQRVKLMRILRR